MEVYMLTLSPSIKNQNPNIPFGIMVMHNVQNPKNHPILNAEKKELEEHIRKIYGHLNRAELKQTSPLMEYNAFYKQFKKTYHVQLQIESIAHKQKALPSVASLVEAMFMAELKNQLLTAGYDYDKLQGPLEVTFSTGENSFIGIGGKEKNPPSKDVVLSDNNNILGSILCGPDHQCRITEQTTNVLFAIYGVPNISQSDIHNHLDDIANYVRIISPDARIETVIVV